MKNLFLFLLIFSINLVQGQEDAKAIYKKGLKYLKNNDYHQADSLFRISFSAEPSYERYKELAKIYHSKGDICTSCMYLKKAEFFGATKADELKPCRKVDTIFYNNDKDPDFQYLSVITRDPCDNDVTRVFVKRKKNKPLDIEYAFISNSPSINEMADFPDMDKNLSDLIFFKTQVDPLFPGGDQARLNYLIKSVVYPKECKEKGISGKVFVTFIVNEDGSLSDIKILRSAGKALDDESLRVVRQMPKWTPGKVNGIAVKSQFNLPFKYTLQY